jgi:hypothetical protein
VKGLSRLPVTEEIAGSNPVERAKKIRPPYGERIFFACFAWVELAMRCEATRIAGSCSEVKFWKSLLLPE